jgi:hypothetical protein
MRQQILGVESDFQQNIQRNLLDTGKAYMSSSGANGGMGNAKIGDGEEYAFFSFTSAGIVTLITNSANVSITEDNDTKFNIFDAGGVVGFNNELGATKELLVVYWLN